MTETEKLIEIYNQLEDAGLMVIAGKKDSAELMVSRDVVPVVRCKDCKHFVAPQGVPCCDNFYGLGFPNVNGNDFCSYGERKTE